MLAGFHRKTVAVPFAASPGQGVVNRPHIELLTDIAEKRQFPASCGVSFGSAGAALFSPRIMTSTADLYGSKVHILFDGNITNIKEICELYGVEITAHAVPTCADLMMHLYKKGFADIYGDDSDQPATLLGALEGDFVCILHDAGMGYFLAVRSCLGGVPLYWGLDAGTDQVVFSSVPGITNEIFPSGIVFESQVLDGKRDSRFQNITRKTPATRGVNTISKIDSQGHMCGMIFKSKSGCDLSASAAGHLDIF